MTAARKPKRGPKPKASDAEITALIAQGLNDSDVARALGCDRKRAKRLRDAMNALITTPTPPVEVIKAAAMVEITQEMAKLKLGQIVGDAERQYNHYMSEGHKDDAKAAYWFGQYQQAVDKLLRASGVYEKAKREAEREPVKSITVNVRWHPGAKIEGKRNDATTAQQNPRDNVAPSTSNDSSSADVSKNGH